KQTIYTELKNIPTLNRGELYSNIFNSNNMLVYLSNTPPKRDELNKLLISFLNSHDGLILYGTDVNSEKLSGFRMTRQQRDKFRQFFNAEFLDYLMEYHGHIK